MRLFCEFHVLEAFLNSWMDLKLIISLQVICEWTLESWNLLSEILMPQILIETVPVACSTPMIKGQIHTSCHTTGASTYRSVFVLVLSAGVWRKWLSAASGLAGRKPHQVLGWAETPLSLWCSTVRWVPGSCHHFRGEAYINFPCISQSVISLVWKLVNIIRNIAIYGSYCATRIIY